MFIFFEVGRVHEADGGLVFFGLRVEDGSAAREVVGHFDGACAGFGVFGGGAVVKHGWSLFSVY